ncbi:4'-phosphopantetheinyl transferase family protein [Streptomyces sp. NPDC002078]
MTVPAVAVASGGGWGQELRESLETTGWAVVRAHLADWHPEPAAGPVPECLPGSGPTGHRGLSGRAARRSFAARTLLRRAVAVVTGTDEDVLEVARTPSGRPYLRGAERMSVSLSHTGDLLVVGISRVGPIGVDAELDSRTVHADALAREFCTAHERTALARLPDEERRTALIRLWTLKEAYSKAMGLGLRLPFGEFGFAPVAARDGVPPTLRHADGTPAAAAGWWFGTHALPHHAVLAVAVRHAAEEHTG